MGRIRTKDIKDLARDLHEVYPEELAGDFEQNKAMINNLNILGGKSKRFRNKVVGYTVCLARQRDRGITAVGERAVETAESVEPKVADEVEAEETKAEETAEASETTETKEETVASTESEEKESASESKEEKTE